MSWLKTNRETINVDNILDITTATSTEMEFNETGKCSKYNVYLIAIYLVDQSSRILYGSRDIELRDLMYTNLPVEMNKNLVLDFDRFVLDFETRAKENHHQDGQHELTAATELDEMYKCTITRGKDVIYRSTIAAVSNRDALTTLRDELNDTLRTD